MEGEPRHQQGKSAAIHKETSMSMSRQQQSDLGGTWKSVPTKFVEVGGTKFAYRKLGPDTGVPVIFLNHLAAELDRWDPRVVDARGL
jgi:hypothetical protein